MEHARTPGATDRREATDLPPLPTPASIPSHSTPRSYLIGRAIPHRKGMLKMANATASKATSGTEIARVLTTEDLRNITDFESAAAALQSVGASIVSSDVLGDGFSLLEDKDKLIGVPCMFVDWTFSMGDHGEFVSARVVAEMPGKTYMKYVVNDGGTGIYAQLREMTNRDANARGLFSKRGLRKSTYNHPEFGPGTTYYVDTAAPSA